MTERVVKHLCVVSPKDLQNRSDRSSLVSTLETLEIKYCKELPSSIEDFKNLKELRIQRGPKFNCIPDSIGGLKSLTHLSITECPKLTKLPKSITRLKNLSELKLECVSLSGLPEDFGELTSLTILSILQSRTHTMHSRFSPSHCREFRSLPTSIGGLKNLSELKIYSDYLVSLPDEFGDLVNLTKLDICCVKLSTLPATIGRLKNLSVLELNSCETVFEFPEEMGELTGLSRLSILSGGNFLLPPTLGNLKNMQEVSIGYSTMPETITALCGLTELRKFTLGCALLKSIPDRFRSFTQLEELNLQRCEAKTLPKVVGSISALKFCSPQRVKLPIEFCGWTQLTMLTIDNAWRLNRLPTQIGNLKNLLELQVSHCRDILTLPRELGNLVLLKKLRIEHCESLEGLPSTLGNLKNLLELQIAHCHCISTLPQELGNLVLLKKLCIEHCEDLEALPSTIGNLKNLADFSVEYCDNIWDLPESLVEMKNLRNLVVHHCDSIVELPQGVHQLTKLETIKITDCSMACVLNYPFPPRLQSLEWNPFPDQSDQFKNEMSEFLKKHKHLSTFSLAVELGFEEYLALNKFRPLFAGEHIVHKNEFPAVLARINDMYKAKTVCNATVIHEWLHRCYVVEPTKPPTKNSKKRKSDCLGDAN